MCLENTSEYESAAAEQRRYRAALISALVKPAAILKLFALCVSWLSYLPLFFFFFSNILPYSPSTQHHHLIPPSGVSGQQLLSVFLCCLPACPVTDCTMHINYSWLLFLRFTGAHTHTHKKKKPITDGVIANGLLLYSPPASLHSSNKYPRDNQRVVGVGEGRNKTGAGGEWVGNFVERQQPRGREGCRGCGGGGTDTRVWW